MVDAGITLFYGVLALQLPIGVLMFFDAKRLKLKNPEKYWLGVVIPAVGFVVVLYYLSERKNLPKEEADGTT
ncbi:hypothetical protein [Halogeometricum luteum]|uniref:Phospholipase_D-nuclease N-terminal n=1 Tax=Halogeometricum luteum TaxID=2950537 RepID=A0ABU2G146_9EURY|nr:hypothetical protein [Halogeometricum sp. S3BR5-2]MDS0294013.1 hypothetical protein [Halogeometricum sp. S3BR5-2]